MVESSNDLISIKEFQESIYEVCFPCAMNGMLPRDKKALYSFTFFFNLVAVDLQHKLFTQSKFMKLSLQTLLHRHPKGSHVDFLLWKQRE